MWLLVLQLHVWIYVFTYAHSMCCWTHLYALWMCLLVCRTWATLCMWVIVGIYVRVCSIVFQRVVAFCPCYLLPTFDRFLKIHDFPTRFRLCCVPRPLLWQTISVITFLFLGLVEHGSGLAGSTCWKPNIHPLNAQFWFCSWSVSEWWWWTFGKVYLDIVKAIIYLKIQGDAKCVCRDCVVLAHKTAAGIDRRELSLCLWSLIVGEECAINAMRYLLFSTCAFGNLSFTYFSSQSTQSVEIWRSTLPLLDKHMSTQSEEASNVHDFFRWMYFCHFVGWVWWCLNGHMVQQFLCPANWQKTYSPTPNLGIHDVIMGDICLKNVRSGMWKYGHGRLENVISFSGHGIQALACWSATSSVRI